MKLLIEGYKYPKEFVTRTLGENNVPLGKDGFVSWNQVGYFYNKQIGDCVFFLPKVLLNQNNLVLDKYKPESIIDLTNAKLMSVDSAFLYSFSTWIYRSVKEFCVNNPDSDNILKEDYSIFDLGSKKVDSSLIDCILNLIYFSEKNKNWLITTIKNFSSCNGKINWLKTFSKKTPLLYEKGPIYLDLVIKKSYFDAEEELFCLFFSILNHIKQKYGFKSFVNPFFKLLPDAELKKHFSAYGKRKLLKIKNNYFSDKTLLMWKLCYAFISRVSEINSSTQKLDYLLVNRFDIVFEAIIDELISDKEVLKPLKNQKDGKLVDHIFLSESLIENSNDLYYIGDSKYYKIGSSINGVAKYKQFTYVKNVIQYNLNLLLNEDSSPKEPVRYRDEITEGYNITPNFFISAELDKQRSYTRSGLKQLGEIQQSKQFHNRLFDRDTLWLSHYSLNFLYVLALYVRGRNSEKVSFKKHARKVFKEAMLKELVNKYSFYKLYPIPTLNLISAVNNHFRELIGKAFRPNPDAEYLLLALENDNFDNDLILESISKSFEINDLTIFKDS